MREKFSFQVKDYFAIYEYERSYFADDEHLNDRGRDAFTMLINKEILS